MENVITDFWNKEWDPKLGMFSPKPPVKPSDFLAQQGMP